MTAAADLHRALEARARRAWCPHVPTTKQAEFLALRDTEAFYGGAAGGGKSDALLMDALQDVDTPGYSAIIFRKTYQDLALPDSIMDRAHQWLGGTDAHWDGVRHRYTFPSGATLQFGYLANPRDKFRYKSAAFQSIGFDELTTFAELDYRYLRSRLRRKVGSNIRLRIRGASNPGDIGHDWVKRRFVLGPYPFIPAAMDDNPFLDVESYRETLADLDEATRRQLEDGIWEQDPAGLLYVVPESSVIDVLPPGPFTLIRALDFGVVNQNSINVLGWRKHDPVTYVMGSRYFVGGPSALGDELAKDARPFVQHIGDLGGMGKAFQEDLQLRFKIPIEMAKKADKLGHIRLFNDAVKRGLVKFHRPECESLLTEYGILLRREDGTEVPKQQNHCADGVLYGWRACPSYLERDAVQGPMVGTAEWEAADARRIEREMVEEGRRGRRRGWLRQMT